MFTIDNRAGLPVELFCFLVNVRHNGYEVRPSVGVDSYRPERFRRGCDGDLVRRDDQHAILTLAERIARSLAVVNMDFRARCTRIAVNRIDDRIVVRLIQQQQIDEQSSTYHFVCHRRTLMRVDRFLPPRFLPPLPALSTAASSLSSLLPFSSLRSRYAVGHDASTFIANFQPNVRL